MAQRDGSERAEGSMQTHSERPRELRWYHAAGMLFGDWGTSRLYVLGAAFIMSQHASFWYIAAMCTLVTLVGFAYTIICAHFPDGGGVYSAAKHRSRNLAVVGALLLVADYVITASLSAYVGFRYLLPEGTPSIYALYAAVAAILAIGALNIFGPRRVGTVALGVAIVSAMFYLIIGIFCIPTFGHATIHAPTEPWSDRWHHFINVILALSGVEAIANMTGIMAEPVGKNSRKAIIAVLAEVILLNLIMAYAMNALPQFRALSQADMTPHLRETLGDQMVRVLAGSLVAPWFASLASFFFGFLLLSAANTAIGDMVSTQYLMSRDKELPAHFTKLNRFGMPWVGLVFATLVPALVLLIVGNHTKTLEDLYAIGVVGAITINLLACGSNFELDLKKWERGILLSVGGLLALIELTIAYDKPKALLFAGIVLGSGLLARHFAKRVPAAPPVPPELKPATPAAVSGVRAAFPASKARVLVPTRGNPKLLKFAIGYAKDKEAALFLLFVREVTLTFRERGGKVAAETMTLANDKEAQQIFATAQKMCDEAGVPMVPLYVVHDSAAEIILDNAALLGVDVVMMGVSQRGALWRTIKGDVLQEVIQYLPEQIPLLIHA